eukprot:114650-Pyramimonas_sp.AAC.1
MSGCRTSRASGAAASRPDRAAAVARQARSSHCPLSPSALGRDPSERVVAVVLVVRWRAQRPAS